MTYDPEAIYQDADIEQAEMERVGAAIHAARQAGRCTHQSAVGYLAGGMHEKQQGLKPGQLRCTDGCDQVFDSDQDWDDARQEALDS